MIPKVSAVVQQTPMRAAFAFFAKFYICAPVNKKMDSFLEIITKLFISHKREL